MDAHTETTETTLPTCYRHPDRETRLSCSNCGRPVCVDCVRHADVGQRCPECAQPAPQVRQVRPARSTTGAPVTMVLLGLSVMVYLVVRTVPGLGEDTYVSLRQSNPDIATGEWWRLLTAAFLHDPISYLHILFNMWALWVFGPELERSVGSPAFLALYLASAVAGGATYFVTTPEGVAVGASGAIFGLFGAWLVAAYRQRHTAWGRASFRQLMVLLGINLALPLLPGTRIAWQAHVGGLAAGMLLAWLWSLPAMRDSAARRTAAGAALLPVAYALVFVT